MENNKEIKKLTVKKKYKEPVIKKMGGIGCLTMGTSGLDYDSLTDSISEGGF